MENPCFFKTGFWIMEFTMAFFQKFNGFQFKNYFTRYCQSTDLFHFQLIIFLHFSKSISDLRIFFLLSKFSDWIVPFWDKLRQIFRKIGKLLSPESNPIMKKITETKGNLKKKVEIPERISFEVHITRWFHKIIRP